MWRVWGGIYVCAIGLTGFSWILRLGVWESAGLWVESVAPKLSSVSVPGSVTSAPCKTKGQRVKAKKMQKIKRKKCNWEKGRNSEWNLKVYASKIDWERVGKVQIPGRLPRIPDGRQDILAQHHVQRIRTYSSSGKTFTLSGWVGNSIYNLLRNLYLKFHQNQPMRMQKFTRSSFLS